MITKKFKVGMFISSYLPLYLFLIIINFSFDLLTVTLAKLFLTILSLLSILSVIVIIIIMRGEGNSKKDLTGIQLKKDEVISYMVTYIVPLQSMDIADVKNIIVNGLLFITIGIGYTSYDLIYLNPALLVMGYKVYEQDDKIIISNMSVDDMRNVEFKVMLKKLSVNIYVARKKDNKTI